MDSDDSRLLVILLQPMHSYPIDHNYWQQRNDGPNSWPAVDIDFPTHCTNVRYFVNYNSADDKFRQRRDYDDIHCFVHHLHNHNLDN